MWKVLFFLLIPAVMAEEIRSWGWACGKGGCEHYGEIAYPTDPSFVLEAGRQIGIDNGSHYGPTEDVFAASWAQSSLSRLKTYAGFDLEYINVGTFDTSQPLALATAYSFRTWIINAPDSLETHGHFLPEYQMTGTVYQGSPDSGTSAFSCAVWGNQELNAPFQCESSVNSTFKTVDVFIQTESNGFTLVPLNQPFIWFTALQTGAMLNREPTSLTLNGRYFGTAIADFGHTLSLEKVLILDQTGKPIGVESVRSLSGEFLTLDPANVITPEPSTFVLLAGTAAAGMLKLSRSRGHKR